MYSKFIASLVIVSLCPPPSETLAVLVYSLGKESFLPLAEDCCLLGLNLCDRIDDPSMRSCA